MLRAHRAELQVLRRYSGRRVVRAYRRHKNTVGKRPYHHFNFTTGLALQTGVLLFYTGILLLAREDYRLKYGRQSNQNKKKNGLGVTLTD